MSFLKLDGIQLKGANLTSAASLLVNVPGDFHDVTGTVTITSLEAVSVGTEKTLCFVAALVLTHHATNLILPGGANITTAAGDFIVVREYAAGQWRCVSFEVMASAPFSSAQQTKLAGIEASATADQTGAEIKTAYEAEANAFTDTKNTKLAGIETAATADQTGAEIKTAYEAEANAYTDTKNTKLAGIETAATADQSDAEIKTAYQTAVPLISQGDAEAGTATGIEGFSAERVKQAIAALGAAGASLATGTYTGDGTTDQGITGLGFAPTLVWVTDRETVHLTAVDPYMTTDTIVDDNAAGGAIHPDGQYRTNKIISLDADGFSVDDAGSDSHPNTNTAVYNFWAIG